MPDYSFYTDVYHGAAVSREGFPEAAARAGDVLARYRRYYRVTEPAPDAAKMAVCAMAEVFAGMEDAGLAGAKVGSVSVTYAENTPRQREAALYAAACRYLDIYRGAGK